MSGTSRLACVAVVAWLFSGLGWAELSPQKSRSASEKLERLESQKLPSGTTVILTEDEINSYLRYDYAADLPQGVTQPHFRLQPDRVTGTAVVDFLKWQASRGASPGFLLRWLLKGQRQVEVTARYTSRDGYGQVDIESVEIGGIPISGDAVHFLIENVVQPRYPAAIVGRPQPLGYNLRQVKIESARVVIITK